MISTQALVVFGKLVQLFFLAEQGVSLMKWHRLSRYLVTITHQSRSVDVAIGVQNNTGHIPHICCVLGLFILEISNAKAMKASFF